MSEKQFLPLTPEQKAKATEDVEQGGYMTETQEKSSKNREELGEGSYLEKEKGEGMGDVEIIKGKIKKGENEYYIFVHKHVGDQGESYEGKVGETEDDLMHISPEEARALYKKYEDKATQGKVVENKIKKELADAWKKDLFGDTGKNKFVPLTPEQKAKATEDVEQGGYMTETQEKSSKNREELGEGSYLEKYDASHPGRSFGIEGRIISGEKQYDIAVFQWTEGGVEKYEGTINGVKIAFNDAKALYKQYEDKATQGQIVDRQVRDELRDAWKEDLLSK